MFIMHALATTFSSVAEGVYTVYKVLSFLQHSLLSMNYRVHTESKKVQLYLEMCISISAKH